MSSWIRLEALEAAISLVTLDRPERRNALGIELLEEFCTVIDQLAADTLQRVVIVRGAGPVFSAGLDLREAADGALIEQSAQAVQRALNVLRETPLVTIAAVHGGAYAGGAGLMAACDIVVATDDARFGFPEARRGLLPVLIHGVLQRRVRDGDLRDLLLTGDVISAQRAHQIGLVQRVVATDRLLDAAVGVARSVCAGGPETIRRTKNLINHHTVHDGKSTSAHPLEEHLAARRSNEAREGLAAFLQKREPKW